MAPKPLQDITKALGDVPERKQSRPVARRRRQTKTQVGSSKAVMQELEHIVDVLEHPKTRPSITVPIVSVATAIGTVGVMLNAASTHGAYTLTTLNMVVIFAQLLNAIVAIMVYVSSKKNDAHHDRAMRYAKEMLEDCTLQDSEDAVVTGVRVADVVQPDGPVEAIEDGAEGEAENASQGEQRGRK